MAEQPVNATAEWRTDHTDDIEQAVGHEDPDWSDPDIPREAPELHTTPAAQAEPNCPPEPNPEAVSDPELVQFATCFSIDYLSWDTDNPQPREQALRFYLCPGVTLPKQPAQGGQRADFASPGRAERRPDNPRVVWVNVWVLVTPYRKTDAPRSLNAGRPAPGPLPGRTSSAPTPSPLGWIPTDSRWVALEVPLRRLSPSRVVVAAELVDTEIAQTGAAQAADDYLTFRGA
jgi:hypothetical protein